MHRILLSVPWELMEDTMGEGTEAHLALLDILLSSNSSRYRKHFDSERNFLDNQMQLAIQKKLCMHNLRNVIVSLSTLNFL